ncbi:MAG TPA: molybdopterin cofactor-binding domain-containing protein [Caulobacteraceae bacterium]|jgi:isoquinoline 1-oxidoreductase beta subunit|nr:molybdopterin cofactor-binding domain-containing protein [Caulobacteraceae bacterium]
MGSAVDILSRRSFLTWSAGGAFMLALPPAAAAGSEASGAAAPLSPWISIAPDGKVTLFTTVSEMGQGARTGQAQILADELDVALEQVSVEMGEDADPFRLDGRLSTGGSSSIRLRFQILRLAGATARAQLSAAAAKRWEARAADCVARDGCVTHVSTGAVLNYGELAAEAAAIVPPDHPPLKAPADWRHIGKPIQDLDIADRTTGKARYGIDVHRPGMVRATIIQAPVFKAELSDVDEAPALAVPGVLKVVRLPGAVAVVARSTYAAFKGALALRPKWSTPDGEPFTLGALGPAFDAAVADAIAKAAPAPLTAPAGGRLLEATYEVPFLAHAPIEPMNATAQVTADKVELWAPAQSVTSTRNAVARALGRPIDQVRLHVTRIGGGFGRRLQSDFAVQAARIAAAIDGPVQLVWRREEDFTHDFYRPAARIRYRGALGADGLLTGFDMLGAAANELVDSHDGPEPYAIAAASTQGSARVGVPTGPWRSVDASITGFMRESFVDECAHAAGKDPLDYRRALIGQNARARRVLDAAAEAIGWGVARKPAVGVGLSLFEGWDTLVAHAVEVEVVDRRIVVRRLVVAGDPGIAVNPRLVKAQLEGASMIGLSAALMETMSFEGGAAAKKNFDVYKVLRNRQSPTVEVILFNSPQAKVGGVGEPATPGAMAALANAVFAATGERVRTLPLASAGFTVA